MSNEIKKPAPSFSEIMEKSAASAIRGGTAGAVAMGANVGALMWMRTTVSLLLLLVLNRNPIEILSNRNRIEIESKSKSNRNRIDSFRRCVETKTETNTKTKETTKASETAFGFGTTTQHNANPVCLLVVLVETRRDETDTFGFFNFNTCGNICVCDRREADANHSALVVQFDAVRSDPIQFNSIQFNSIQFNSIQFCYAHHYWFCPSFLWFRFL